MAKRKTTIKTGDYKYGTLKVRGKDGKLHYSAGNGDAVHKSMLLHVAGGGTMKQIIDANKLNVDAKNTNMGLVRMSVGVALRGKVRNGEPVKVGKITVKSLKQAVTLPKVEIKAAPGKGKAKKSKPAKKAKRKAARKPRSAPPAEATQASEAAPQG